MPAATASGGRTRHRKSPEWNRVMLCSSVTLDVFEIEDAWCEKLEDYFFKEIPHSIQP